MEEQNTAVGQNKIHAMIAYRYLNYALSTFLTRQNGTNI